MDKKPPTVLFVWMGDYVERLLTGITKTKPEAIRFVVETKDKEWEKWHNEISDMIFSQIGGVYRDYFDIIKIDHDIDEEKSYEKMISTVTEEVNKLKKKYEKVDIIWDLTAAPTSAQLILSLVGSLLSNENITVWIQRVSRQSPNTPIYHVWKGTKYFKENIGKESESIPDIPLHKINEQLALDKGDKIMQIQCPKLNYKLLNEDIDDIENTLVTQFLYKILPSSSDPLEDTSEIERKLKEIPLAKRLLLGAAYRRKKNHKGTINYGDIPPNFDVASSTESWLNRRWKEWREGGLITIDSDFRKLKIRRTPAGDLLMTAVSKLNDDLFEKWKGLYDSPKN